MITSCNNIVINLKKCKFLIVKSDNIDNKSIIGRDLINKFNIEIGTSVFLKFAKKMK